MGVRAGWVVTAEMAGWAGLAVTAGSAVSAELVAAAERAGL